MTVGVMGTMSGVSVSVEVVVVVVVPETVVVELAVAMINKKKFRSAPSDDSTMVAVPGTIRELG